MKSGDDLCVRTQRFLRLLSVRGQDTFSVALRYRGHPRLAVRSKSKIVERESSEPA